MHRTRVGQPNRIVGDRTVNPASVESIEPSLAFTALRLVAPRVVSLNLANRYDISIPHQLDEESLFLLSEIDDVAAITVGEAKPTDDIVRENHHVGSNFDFECLWNVLPLRAQPTLALRVYTNLPSV